MIKLSPYTICFQEENGYYIFNGVSRFFSEISKDLYISLKNRDWDALKDEIDFLKEKYIILEEEELDQFFYETRVNYMTNSFGSKHLTLVIAPTTACNFDCPYCFEPKRNPKYMTKEVEDALIKYINNQDYAESISIVWYGGEPLLAFDTIKRLYYRIQEECDKKITRQEIITNGYLINDDVIEFIKNTKLDMIQFSLDGIEENHNKTRCLKADGSGTFRKIQENIEKLAKAIPNLPIAIRVNVNKKNYEDVAILYEYYNSSNWQKKIGVYPGILRIDAKDGIRYCQSCYDNGELYELYSKLQNKGLNVSFFPKIAYKGCMIQRTGAFIIGPEGELYKCWNDVSDPNRVVGSIMDNKHRNYSLLLKYVNEIDPFDEKCKRCHAFPICDGGCGHVRFRNKYENGEFDYCSPFKNIEILKKALLQSTKENPDKDKQLLQF